VGFGGSLCSCHPLQSLAKQQGATARAAPLPWGSPEAGLGTLPMIALRCSFHATVRSGSVGLPRALHGLTTASACAGLRRTFEVFRIASSTNQHCCRVIIDPLFGSPTEPLPAARTGSRRPPLLGLDRSSGLPRTPGPIAPPSALHLLAKDRPRVHSRQRTEARHLRPPDANPEVLFRPRGFSPPRRVSPRSGAQACCILPPTMGFATFHADQPKPAAIPATRPPLEGLSHPPVVLRSPGALAPVAFDLAESDRWHHC